MYYFSLIISLLQFTSFASPTPPLQQFLQSNATEVSWEEVYGNIRFFLNSRYKKEEIYWYTGSLISSKGDSYEELQLKFNTTDNSLFLKKGQHYFRIKTSALREFYLQDVSRTRHFVKGYFKSREHQLKGDFEGHSHALLDSIMAYDHFGLLEITALHLTSKKGLSGQIEMKLSSPGLASVQQFRSYLQQTGFFSDLQFISGATGLGQQTFFEELVQGRGITLLKYYSRKQGQNEMLSIVGDAATELTFHHNQLFIANTHHQLQEVIPSRKSIRKALLFAELEWEGKISGVRKERQVVAFFKKVLKE